MAELAVPPARELRKVPQYLDSAFGRAPKKHDPAEAIIFHTLRRKKGLIT